ncbi:MAG: SGNH/GDSL hydrolase family protein [Candidatus Pacebacteria bacterium]|nr:SGNH/GDSL hydrolase family protein [Candidatus Paceibacterota bacterium]
MPHREHIEWLDVWVEAAEEPSVSRVLLVGDSITRSYYPHVNDRLKETFACARLATSKCVSDPLFLKELKLVLDEYEFSIVHFNNGLHGWDYNEDAYASGLARTLDALCAHSATGTIIWGSTTPVRQKGALEKLDAKTDRVRERNRIAATLADSRGIPVNDLFNAAVKHPEYFAEDGVHFGEAGQAVLGNLVAEAILAAAG